MEYRIRRPELCAGHRIETTLGKEWIPLEIGTLWGNRTWNVQFDSLARAKNFLRKYRECKLDKYKDVRCVLYQYRVSIRYLTKAAVSRYFWLAKLRAWLDKKGHEFDARAMREFRSTYGTEEIWSPKIN